MYAGHRIGMPKYASFALPTWSQSLKNAALKVGKADEIYKPFWIVIGILKKKKDLRIFWWFSFFLSMYYW